MKILNPNSYFLSTTTFLEPDFFLRTYVKTTRSYNTVWRTLQGLWWRRLSGPSGAREGFKILTGAKGRLDFGQQIYIFIKGTDESRKSQFREHHHRLVI